MLAARDEMLITLPAPASTICGTQSWVSENAASTLNRKAASMLRTLVFITGLGSQPPALFTRIVTRPSSPAAATRAASWSASVTSVGTARARRPSASTSAATASRSLAVRAASTTSAPASARATAHPAPMPLPAPVTMATWSERSKRSRIIVAEYRSAVSREPVRTGDEMSEPVLVEVADGVATVTINRPEARNALNRAVRHRLPAVIEELEADDTVDVMILTGADPAFSAGVDLKEFGSGQVEGEELRSGGNPGPESVDMGGRGRDGQPPWRGALPPRTKLLIGAVNGVAITGGLELALACDFLIASDQARFADTHARVGVMPGWGLTVLLPQRVGVARAREMSVTGNFVDAALAY